MEQSDSLPQKKRKLGDRHDEEESIGLNTPSAYRNLANHDRGFRAPEINPEVLIVHTVSCSRIGTHSDHPGGKSYLDQPRLFANDHKASPLRGRYGIDDVSEYIDQHEDACIVVYRRYSCDKHHKSVVDRFERLQLPHQNTTVGSKIRPYLFALCEDTEPAKCQGEFIMILSSSLSDVLAKFGCVGTLQAPYLPLYHQRQPMAVYLRTAGEPDKQRTLTVLLKYLDENFSAEYDEADALFAEGRVSKKHFSKLFGPDEIIVSRINEQTQAYMAKTTPESNFLSVVLECWSWIFDGQFKQRNISLDVKWPKSMNNTIEIHDLDVYPLRFDDTGLEERLRCRGQKFWDFRVKKYVSYSAERQSFDVHTSNPRYMIDMRMYDQMHPREPEDAPEVGNTLDPAVMKDDEMPAEPFALLLPTTTMGYGLHDKKWRHLIVEFVEDISWNETAFERLVLSSRKKEIIKALVTVHVATSPSTDIIEGKGNGLIMLLHGSPGTGKTLTAESIAELTHKPLYRVTCGDIGTEPEAVEKYLESVLYIGTTWGCVVLLDEADVFLEERTQSDLQRNALVSVFLRVLEYYDGILILTSNRVGTFDEAFKSRIQLAVHYPPLDEKGRLRIWYDFINSLNAERDNANVERLNANVPFLGSHELNGRQIRNTVKNARQYAYYKGEKLGYEHFDAVIEIANEFEQYLIKTHGHKESDWARAEGIRAE